jgi:hypothetical protein
VLHTGKKGKWACGCEDNYAYEVNSVEDERVDELEGPEEDEECGFHIA